MQQHRPFVSIAIAAVCVLILSGVALACVPPSPDAALVRPAKPSPSATPDQKLPATPPQSTSPLDTSGATDAIQYLGLHTYPNIYAGGYAGEVLNPDAPLTIYLGPGDDTAFVNALHALLASPRVQSFGPEPAIAITRVPHSQADFDVAQRAYLAAHPQLEATGYIDASSGENVPAGTYDVWLVSAPHGMTADDATAVLQKTVSPIIHVVTVNAPPNYGFENPGGVAPP